MRKLMVIFALFLSVLNVYADIISANNVTLKNGETTKLDITLENAKEDIVGLQFNLVLPEGVTPVIEEGDVKITPSNRLNGTYVVRGSKVADGSYLFTFLSNDRTPIQGNNGTLFSILLRNDNAANGDYTATLYGVTTTNLAGQEQSCPNESFSVSVEHKYKLTYYVDGTEYKSIEYIVGSAIYPIDSPSKEGYTFSGWSSIPSTMPATDVTVTGSFSVNSYKITYIVDGQVYSESIVTYGTPITPLDVPTKEGYTFSGWSDIPATMPAHDVIISGSFATNTYLLTYMVDGQVYQQSHVVYGTTITPLDVPTKEGYTFWGWSDIPATMPAGNVTIEGYFTVNSYKLTYMVDGEVFYEVDVAYGTSLPVIDAPQREGYTFTGWNNIPASMPAGDVTIEGSFRINTYTITYMYDGQEVGRQNVVFGDAIPVFSYSPEDNEQYTYTFEGWADEAGNPVELTIMPAHDVVVYAIISVADGISGLTAYSPKSGIYALSGAQICGKENIKDVLPTLPKGLYIINGKVYMKK